MEGLFVGGWRKNFINACEELFDENSLFYQLRKEFIVFFIIVWSQSRIIFDKCLL